MGFGISVKNLSGTVTLNETYQNYHLVAKGTYANGGGPPALAAGEICFIRPSVVGADLYKDAAYTHPTSSSGSVQYAIMKDARPSSSETFGLKVFTDTGVVAFDSGRSFLTPVSISRIGIGSVVGVTQPYAPIAGRSRYVSYSSFCITGIAESGAGVYDHFRRTWMTWNSDTYMTLYEEIDGSTAAPGGTDWPIWAGSLLFIFADI